ncbi:hypothetical protein [Streptomyces cylindrosporus]|uniref:Uncharacterized protein n=1 Tax=Streptomyces cylindrosporus TaxID=2927583 RepID=A0ABS9YFM7_9ACTN|nr:hypothetical protein [Streptomyces cylindrosporus]MCI3276035.1 hypothetical protein [Streptomyces cylindrosporus]
MGSESAGREPSVNFGNISGNNTFAVGSHARAESHHVHHGGAGQLDDSAAELLKAVRDLRADLREKVRSSEQTVALDEALAETETELTTTGQATPTRRERLRELLTDSQALLTVLASAGTVAGLVGLRL